MKNTFQLERDLLNIRERNQCLLEQLHDSIAEIEDAHNYLRSLRQDCAMGEDKRISSSLPKYKLYSLIKNKISQNEVPLAEAKRDYEQRGIKNLHKASQLGANTRKQNLLSKKDVERVTQIYKKFGLKIQQIELMNDEIRTFRKARANSKNDHSTQSFEILNPEGGALPHPKKDWFKKWRLFRKGNMLEKLNQKFSNLKKSKDVFGCFE